MANDVMSWRVAIGIFNSKIGCVVKSFRYASTPFAFISDVFIFLFMKLKFLSSNLKSYMQSSILNLEFTFVIFLLVVLSGNVEINPGPSTDVQTSSLSILHVNIRSIRNKIEYIKDNYLDYDILCFTETHLSATINNELLKLDGFSTMYRKDRTNHSSGLLIYTSNNIISSRLNVLEIPNLDTLWIEI
jgi:hypothetical protein